MIASQPLSCKHTKKERTAIIKKKINKIKILWFVLFIILAFAVSIFTYYQKIVIVPESPVNAQKGNANTIDSYESKAISDYLTSIGLTLTKDNRVFVKIYKNEKNYVVLDTQFNVFSLLHFEGTKMVIDSEFPRLYLLNADDINSCHPSFGDYLTYDKSEIDKLFNDYKCEEQNKEPFAGSRSSCSELNVANYCYKLKSDISVEVAKKSGLGKMDFEELFKLHKESNQKFKDLDLPK